jgi:opacity protein-like surface antigen
MFKSIKLAAVSMLALSSVVLAGDLPSKTAPAGPSAPSLFSETSYYVGGFIGSETKKVEPWYGALRGGVNAGYNVTSFAAVEAAYEYQYSPVSALRSNTVYANGVGQLKVPFIPVVPYALAGVGYRLSDAKNEPVFNIGGGVKYEVTSNIDLDVRYRYVSDFDRKLHSNAVTLGAAYKF